MPEEKATMGGEVRRLRAEKGLSLAALGSVCGVTRGYIHQVEKNLTTFRAASDFANKLSAALGVPLSHWAPFTSDGHLLANSPPAENSQLPTLHKIDPADYREIPDWGEVAAGKPRLFKTSGKTIIMLHLPPDGDFVSFVVRGKSMTKAHVTDGSRIVIRIGPPPEPGDEVVAIIDGTGITLKKLQSTRDGLMLVSYGDEKTKPIACDSEGVEVLGVLYQIILNRK